MQADPRAIIEAVERADAGLSREAWRPRRPCTAVRADGEPCQAWAVWGDPLGRCWAHGGRSIMPRKRVCACGAYPWPHRPGGGLCRWPDPPQQVWPHPAGTRSAANVSNMSRRQRAMIRAARRRGDWGRA